MNSAFLITILDGSASNLRVKQLSKTSFAVVVTGKASLDGSFFNPETAEKPPSSAREYDRFPVRTWDRYITPEKNTIWYARLEKHGTRFGISPVGFVNALQDTGLEYPGQDPLYPEGFDLSTNGMFFTAFDPAANQAIILNNELYHIPVRTYTEHPAPAPHRISVPHFNGIVLSPTFSRDGGSAAFLRTKEPDNDCGRPHIFLIPDTKNVDELAEVATSDSWDLLPQSVAFSSDSTILYLTAEDCGRRKLFKIPLIPDASDDKEKVESIAFPSPITSSGSVSSVHAVSPTLLLITFSSFTQSSVFAALDPYAGTMRYISHNTDYGSSHFAQSPSQISEIHFQGAGPYTVQAFIVKPSFFSSADTKRKYPLLFWIHGGPVSSFPDAWSTRWNPAFWAEQGYVVVLTNPTGSLGFGQDFIEAIKCEWGGRPYGDLVNCFEHIKSHLDYVDTTRAVAMGGSYGGYMINWIAGQPFADNFQALVTHDGIFSAANLLAGDDIAQLPPNFGGQLWQNPAQWAKWDPSRHTDRWRTPMLVIHSERDYRCPVTEGLAAFGVCQARGVESKFLSFEDESHWVAGRENSKRWHEVVGRWCGRFCGVEGEAGI